MRQVLQFLEHPEGLNGTSASQGGYSYSRPMMEGARVSKLWKKLEAADVQKHLSKEEIRRITLWLDCNSNFYGAYRETKKQANGDVVKPETGVPAWSDFNQLVH